MLTMLALPTAIGIIGVVVAIVLAPLAAESQGPEARIGLLAPAEEPRFSQIALGLKQGLREQGYREDTIHVIEGRTARGDQAVVQATVQRLAAQRVAVLFVVGSALVRPARDTAQQLPIVFNLTTPRPLLLQADRVIE